jgi:hypothetical protein
MLKSKLQDWIAKFEFWYVRKWIKYDVHYTFFLNLENPEAFSIKILKKYPDTIIEFNDIRVGDDGLMNFDLSVIANPRLHDTESKRFKKFTSDVMRSMIMNSIENYGKNNENRNADFVELDSERTILEESPSVPKKRVSKRKPRKETL